MDTDATPDGTTPAGTTTDAMSPDAMIAKLRQARAIVDQVVAGTEAPQIQSILKHADMNLHWALWNPGAVDGLRPDLPDAS